MKVTGIDSTARPWAILCASSQVALVQLSLTRLPWSGNVGLATVRWHHVRRPWHQKVDAVRYAHMFDSACSPRLHNVSTTQVDYGQRQLKRVERGGVVKPLSIKTLDQNSCAINQLAELTN